jgi:hypothetical protein
MDNLSTSRKVLMELATKKFLTGKITEFAGGLRLPQIYLNKVFRKIPPFTFKKEPFTLSYSPLAEGAD